MLTAHSSSDTAQMNNEKFASGVGAVLTSLGWFDPAYYLETYPDIRNYPLGPVRHFVEHGVGEGRVPARNSLLPFVRATFNRFVQLGILPGYENATNSAFFRWALLKNTVLIPLMPGGESGLCQVALLARTIKGYAGTSGAPTDAKLNDSESFLYEIAVEMTQGEALDLIARARQIAARHAAVNLAVLRRSEYFDIAYYLERNPDVAQAGIDPVEHYLTCGGLEKRDPSPLFSSEYYLANNSDVKALGINPLLHFVMHGAEEGRRPRPGLISVAPARRLAAPAGAFRLAQSAHDLVANPNIKAVSFDFFDTLVERPHADPHTVFSIMAAHPTVIQLGLKGFRALRVEAERVARSKTNVEVTLDAVYDELQQMAGIGRRDSQRLLALEKSTELAGLRVRPLGIGLLEAARSRGLLLAVTSDFYLGEAFLRIVMRRLGIRQDDIHVFVSADLGHTKHHGSMFRHITRELGVQKQQILHVGDNAHSDQSQPVACGMRACLVPTDHAMVAARSAIDAAIASGNPGGTSLNLAAVRNFRAQQDLPAEPGLREAAELGYKIVGPVLAAFTAFIDRMARLQQADHLVFLSRDTRLVYDIFSRRRKQGAGGPAVSYLLVSRQSILGAASVDFRAVDDVVGRDYTEFSFAGMLRERFLFDEADLKALLRAEPWLANAAFFDEAGTMAETVDIFKEYAKAVYQSVRKVASRRASAYDAYLQTVAKKGKRPLLVDIGYRGTTQKALCEQFGFAANAVYFMTWREIASVSERGLGAWSFVSEGSHVQQALTRSVSLLELLLSDPNAGSLRCFEHPKGQRAAAPVLSDNLLNEAQRAYLNTAHAFAIRCADHLAAVGVEAEYLAVPGIEALEVLGRVLAKLPAEFARTFADTEFEDKFGGTRRQILEC